MNERMGVLRGKCIESKDVEWLSVLRGSMLRGCMN